MCETHRTSAVASTSSYECTLCLEKYCVSKLADTFASPSLLLANSTTELDVGRVLGRGGFGVVNEIDHITLIKSETSTTNNGPRSFMATSCRRNHHGKEKSSRYAIKRLQEHTRNDPVMLFRGVVDLALEARFLSALRHPNILSLRGAAATDPYNGNFFLILDRLYEILTTKLKSWKKQQPGKLLDRSGKKRKALYVERCQVAYDVSCALKYMHSLK